MLNKKMKMSTVGFAAETENIIDNAKTKASQEEN